MPGWGEDSVFIPFEFLFQLQIGPYRVETEVSADLSGFFKIPPTPGKSQHEQNTSKDASTTVSRQSLQGVLKHSSLPSNGSAVVIMTAIVNCRCLFQSLQAGTMRTNCCPGIWNQTNVP